LRIAVLSDTHIPVRLNALPGVVYEVCAGSDLIIHAGDIEARSVIRDLERFAPVKAVHGNMDGIAEQQAYPDSLTLNIEGERIAVTHGRGSAHGLRQRLLTLFEPDSPTIIIHGHTHEFFWGVEQGIRFLNPGAVAGPAGSRSMATLILNEGSEPEVERTSF
jgi:uncharacterized protein